MTDPNRRRPARAPPQRNQSMGTGATIEGSAVTLAIGELAREFAISTRTIRFYEARGLIQPDRRGATRIFTSEHRRRLALIVRAKNLGLTLEEIGEHLALFDPPPQEAGALCQLQALADRQIALLNTKRGDLDGTLRDVRQIRKAIALGLQRARRQTDG